MVLYKYPHFSGQRMQCMIGSDVHKLKSCDSVDSVSFNEVYLCVQTHYLSITLSTWHNPRRSHSFRCSISASSQGHSRIQGQLQPLSRSIYNTVNTLPSAIAKNTQKLMASVLASQCKNFLH